MGIVESGTDKYCNSTPTCSGCPLQTRSDGLERAAWRPPRPVAQCRQFQEEAEDASVSECTWTLSALEALHNALYKFKTYLLTYLINITVISLQGLYSQNVKFRKSGILEGINPFIRPLSTYLEAMRVLLKVGLTNIVTLHQLIVDHRWCMYVLWHQPRHCIITVMRRAVCQPQLSFLFRVPSPDTLILFIFVCGGCSILIIARMY